MNKYLIPLVVFLLVFYSGIVIFNSFNSNYQFENPEYQAYISEYRQIIDNKLEVLLQQSDDQSKYDLIYQSSSPNGTIGNFEGPQVHLKAVKFHNEILTGEDERLKHFDGVSAHFDPDHPCFGLPDVKISVQDVRLYQPERNSFSQFFSFASHADPQPYKIYRKKIKTDSLGVSSKYLVMQLWLTEFQVNIDIKPDKDCMNISNEEKESTSYPGFWYGSNQKYVPLKDIKKEHKDNRYGNLSFIFEVIPDKSPIYLKTLEGSTAKADFAVAAVYCNEAKIGNEPNVQRISTNVHSGQPLFLYDNFEMINKNMHAYFFSPHVDSNAEKLLELKANKSEFIWNKPYYLKIYFNNLGTWRDGLFNQNEYHDQVNFKFLMPLFVVGSWDILAPQEILPKWEPPQPYIKKFSLRNILPFWDFGIFGKIFNIVVLTIIVIGLVILLPKVFWMIKVVNNSLRKKSE